MTAPPPPGPTRFTARSPEDLLAVVPVVLGFVPQESIVMLTFGAVRPFHARVDLPTSLDEVPAVVDALCGPARRHRVPRVVLVLYAARAALVTRVVGALVDAFEEAGIEVVDAMRADGRRWYPLLGRRPEAGSAGVAYDVSAHPFAAQSVLDGRVTHWSRTELAASLGPEPERVSSLAAALASLPRWGREGDDETWAPELVRRHIVSGSSPGDEEVARLLLAVRDEGPCQAVCARMTRADAPGQVAFWTDVVRRAPDHLLAAPAALLGVAAWLAGHGALAWCALDRCLAVDPDHRLAAWVGAALGHAVPPDAWEGDADAS